MEQHLPHSPACERNREPILQVLRRWLSGTRRVLEVGSGTGQHAVHFAAALPQLEWQASDRAQNLPGIRQWLADAALPNTPQPLTLDANDARWAAAGYDAAFSANTLHIMSWPEVERLAAHLDRALLPEATLIVYGPFRYAGGHTSDSNAAFDLQLKAADPHRGVRDFEAVDVLLASYGFNLAEDCEMPANNRCIVWQRRGRSRPSA